MKMFEQGERAERHAQFDVGIDRQGVTIAIKFENVRAEFAAISQDIELQAGTVRRLPGLGQRRHGGKNGEEKKRNQFHRGLMCQACYAPLPAPDHGYAVDPGAQSP